MQLTSTFDRSAGTRSRSIIAAIAAGLLAGACSSGSGVSPLEGLLGSAPAQVAKADGADNGQAARPKTELDKAIEHWGDQYKKQPHDLKTALAYARNLKAAGHKDQAFAIVQNASMLHGDSKELASEYGRLALEFDQIALAEKLLATADDPTKPDWRIVSARGTVLAKQGKYADAVPFYERALALKPDQASTLNNLAMAYAANGEPARAEQILRQASSSSADPKIKQNLALVVGIQGKHDEAKVIAAANMGAEAAQAEVDYIKRMVKTPATATPAATPAVVTRAQPKAAPQPRVIEAKSTAPARKDQLRPSGGPADVPSASGAWTTTVSR